MKYKYFIGIDPGKDGGVALVDQDHTVRDAFIYDDTKFYSMLKSFKNCNIDVWLEQVWPRPHAKAMSTFNFGVAYGRPQSLLRALGFDINFVPPNKWKKDIGVTYDKQTSINKAKELFPEVSLIPDRHKKEHDGIAEALLIAEFGYIQWKKGLQ